MYALLPYFVNETVLFNKLCQFFIVYCHAVLMIPFVTSCVDDWLLPCYANETSIILRAMPMFYWLLSCYANETNIMLQAMSMFY